MAENPQETTTQNQNPGNTSGSYVQWGKTCKWVFVAVLAGPAFLIALVHIYKAWAYALSGFEAVEAIVCVVKALDEALIGLAVVITIIMLSTFVVDCANKPSTPNNGLRSLDDLKPALLGVTATVIAVQFMAKVLEVRGDLQWQHSVVPFGALLIAAAAWLFARSRHGKP